MVVATCTQCATHIIHLKDCPSLTLMNERERNKEREKWTMVTEVMWVRWTFSCVNKIVDD